MTQVTSSQRKTGLLPHWARSSHPVYNREMQHWARASRWRWLRIGCAPLALLVFLGIGSICALSTVGFGTLATQETVLEWGFILLLTLGTAQAFILIVTSLIATALTATTISSEIESETYSLVRVTDIPAREIALAKYAAALYQLRIPLLIIMGVRLLVALGSVLLIELALRTPEISVGGIMGVLASLPLEISPITLSITLLLGSVMSLAYYLAMPLLLMMLHAAIGLYASAITRTRLNGIVTAAGLRVAFAVGIAVANQVFYVGLQILVVSVPDVAEAFGLWLDTLITNRPATLFLYVLLVTGVSLLWNLVWRGGLTSLLVRASARRMQHLPYR